MPARHTDHLSMSNRSSADDGTRHLRPVGLHVCAACSSHLVQLTAFEDAGDRHWHLTLRCPECWATSWCTVPDEACAELDHELDRGVAALLAALAEVQREIMAHDIDTFVAALAAGFVLPEDF
jgi:hypothetical protein